MLQSDWLRYSIVYSVIEVKHFIFRGISILMRDHQLSRDRNISDHMPQRLGYVVLSSFRRK